MVTYPLDVPTNFKVQSSNFRLLRASAVSQSPFTYSQQRYLFPGAVWQDEISLRAYNRATIGAIQGFLAKLRGRFGTFRFGDPDYLARGPEGALTVDNVSIAGAGQTGNTIIVDGLDLSTTRVLAAGDYIQIGDDLHIIVDDADSNAIGASTINIEPALRQTPPDDLLCPITGAKGVFRLVESDPAWSANQSSVYSITLPIIEALSI